MDKLVLVHFSDIHIGSTLLGTVRYKPLEARNGHSILLCQHLQNSFSRGRRDSVPNDFELGNDERLHFVLSGDLTRVGSRNDFHLAFQWLHSQWTLPGPTQPPRQVGLTLPANDLHSVPGNHDQWEGHSPSLWQGISPPAYNPRLAPTWFKATPWHVAIPSPKKEFVLDLFGVDSNSGLAGEGGNFFAEGAISDAQFKVLGAMLKESRKAETADRIPRLRAIVCHHSFHQVGATACLRTFDRPADSAGPCPRRGGDPHRTHAQGCARSVSHQRSSSVLGATRCVRSAKRRAKRAARILGASTGDRCGSTDVEGAPIPIGRQQARFLPRDCPSRHPLTGHCERLRVCGQVRPEKCECFGIRAALLRAVDARLSIAQRSMKHFRDLLTRLIGREGHILD